MKTPPRLKRIRALETPLPGLTRKRPREDANPPGQHGATRRRKLSEYARQLREKQKARLNYGISERQMRRYLAEAARLPGVTGDELFSLLERRLANVVFRLGFAPTGPSARQLVSHGHVRVNDRRVDRAGQLAEIHDVITLSDKAYRNPHVTEAMERGPQVRLPSYLLRTDDGRLGRVISMPVRDDVPFIVDAAAIVEFYAR
jgi:small subunit ribosomal protein S4